MRKSLNMITLHIIDIHFEPNNTFPHIWILHVALFDPIGSPLHTISKRSYYEFIKTEVASLGLRPRMDASFLLLLLRVSIAEVGRRVRGVRPGMINDARNSFLPSRTRRKSPFWQCLVCSLSDIRSESCLMFDKMHYNKSHCDCDVITWKELRLGPLTSCIC